jgi:FkbM family methyltransferase
MTEISAVNTLAIARANFASGRITREEYWRTAAACYQALRTRTPLDPKGQVMEIREDAGGLVIQLRDGLAMRWDPRDVRTAPNVLLNHGDYERAEMATLTALAEHATVVFDVGANVGWYTLHLARQVAAKQGKVYAFEPIPRTRKTLEENIELNDLQGVATVLPLGLGEMAGEVTFFVPGDTGSVAASQRQLMADEKNLQVVATVARLDDVVAEHRIRRLDLIKCDIEGGELLMLRGGADTIRHLRPALFLELLRKWSRAYGYHPDDVINLLAAEGYRCWAIAEGGLESMTRMTDECASTNFLFLHEGHEALRSAVDVRLRTLR